VFYLNWYRVMRQGEAEGSAAGALAHTLHTVIAYR
jgi:hypothetical protein